MFTSAVFASDFCQPACGASKNTSDTFAFVKDILLAGLALMLVFEGASPFLAPKTWCETFRRVIELSDGQLRFAGLASIAIGLALLFM